MPTRLKRFFQITVLFALTAGLVLAVVWGVRLYTDVSRLRDLAAQAKALKAGGLTLESLPRACVLADQLTLSTQRLQDDLAPLDPLVRGLSPLPVVGPYLRQVDPGLIYLSSLSQAGSVLCQVVHPSEAGLGSVPQLSELLAQNAPALTRVETLLQQAQDAGAQIDPQRIPLNYQDDLTQVNAGIPLALQSLPLARELPALLDLANQAQAIRTAGLQLESLQKAYQLTQAAAQLTARLQREMQPFYPVIRSLPSTSAVGQSMLQVEPLLDYLDHLARAGVILSEAAAPLWQTPEASEADLADPEPQQKWTRLLVEKQPEIAQAADLLRQAAADRARIDPQRLPENFRAPFAAVDALLAQAPSLLQTLQIAPRLSGMGLPQTYLILVQNRDELRASGGFVSAFGLLRLDDARISMLDIQDSTQLNYVAEVRAPPEPIKVIMQANYLVARDANWSPDFPTAARQTQEMYALSTGIPTDGVIAFDQGALVSLLQFLGPLTVPGEARTVDAGNVEAVMVQYKQAAISAGSAERRKDFLAILAPLLIEKMKAVRQPQKLAELAKQIQHLIRSGHLQVYFNAADAQDLLQRFALDGAVQPGPGDFLMLVDSNLGISKVDQFVKRSLRYRVDLSDPQQPTAAIHLQYQLPQAGSEPCHQGVSQPPNPVSESYYFVRCYWNYWRVLLPGDTRLKSSQFDPVPASYFDDPLAWKNEVAIGAGENGTRVLAGLVVVPQGQTREVVLQTQLSPASLQVMGKYELVYQLRLQKQAGIEPLPVEIQVVVPHGYTLRSAPDGWTYQRDPDLYVWNGNITEPEDFILEFGR
jgi:hypothetical protein